MEIDQPVEVVKSIRQSPGLSELDRYYQNVPVICQSCGEPCGQVHIVLSCP